MDTAQHSHLAAVDWLAASPIGPHAAAFKHHLAERRYATHTIASYVAEVTHFARWAVSGKPEAFFPFSADPRRILPINTARGA